MGGSLMTFLAGICCMLNQPHKHTHSHTWQSPNKRCTNLLLFNVDILSLFRWTLFVWKKRLIYIRCPTSRSERFIILVQATCCKNGCMTKKWMPPESTGHYSGLRLWLIRRHKKPKEQKNQDYCRHNTDTSNMNFKIQFCRSF